MTGSERRRRSIDKRNISIHFHNRPRRQKKAWITLNALVMGAWAILLHRYSGEQDIVFGATRACRKSTVAGAEDMIGLFINTLPVRLKLSSERLRHSSLSYSSSATAMDGHASL